MEYVNANGTLSQGYYCPTCGKTCNMYATGHGTGKCTPNPALVARLNELNKPGAFKEPK